MVTKSESALQGMKEIRAYCRRSESTIMGWIQSRGFPASKIGGGIWESDRVLIDQWRRKHIESGEDPMEGVPIGAELKAEAKTGGGGNGGVQKARERSRGKR